MPNKKAIVYLRQFDFTDLSYYKSRKYGIERAVYQYIGSTDESIAQRTSKWVYKNIRLDNEIGRLLRALMQMKRFKSIKELNKYIVDNTRVLKECECIEQARATESTMISINKSEGVIYSWIICLNKRDAEVEITADGKYIIK